MYEREYLERRRGAVDSNSDGDTVESSQQHCQIVVSGGTGMTHWCGVGFGKDVPETRQDLKLAARSLPPMQCRKMTRQDGDVGRARQGRALRERERESRAEEHAVSIVCWKKVWIPLCRDSAGAGRVRHRMPCGASVQACSTGNEEKGWRQGGARTGVLQRQPRLDRGS